MCMSYTTYITLYVYTIQTARIVHRPYDMSGPEEPTPPPTVSEQLLTKKGLKPIHSYDKLTADVAGEGEKRGGGGGVGVVGGDKMVPVGVVEEGEGEGDDDLMNKLLGI